GALRLITEAVIYPRGGDLDTTLDGHGRPPGAWRQRLIAVALAATLPSGAQRRRLAAALAPSLRHRVHLNVVGARRGVGGSAVQVGYESIAGSVASRLAQLRQRLAS